MVTVSFPRCMAKKVIRVNGCSLNSLACGTLQTINGSSPNRGICSISVMLLGQNVNSYNNGGGDIPFPELLKKNIPLYGVCENTQVRAFDTPEMLKKNINNANQEGK